MTCTEVREHLPVFADGELSGDEKRRVEAHVASCPRCAAEVQRWQSLRRAAQRVLAAEGVPPNLGARVAAALAARKSPQRTRRLLVLSGAGLSAAAVLALLLWVSGIFQKPAPARPMLEVVQAADLAKTHADCAVTGLDDYYGTVGKDIATARELIKPYYEHTVHLPELAADGYRFDAACCCYGGRGNTHPQAKVMHAAYHSAANPKEHLSFFEFSKPVSLGGSDAELCGPGGRRYRLAHMAGGVTILSWDQHQRSFALCGAKPDTELRDLADSIKLAAFQPAREGIFAFALPAIGEFRR